MNHDHAKDSTAGEANNKGVDAPQRPVRQKSPKHRVRKVIIGTVAFSALFSLLQFFESPLLKFLYCSLCFLIGFLILRLELQNYESTKRKATAASVAVFLFAEFVGIFLFLVQPLIFKIPQSSFKLSVQIGDDNPGIVSLTNTYLVAPNSKQRPVRENRVLVVPFYAGQTNVPFVFLIKNDSTVDADGVQLVVSIPKEIKGFVSPDWVKTEIASPFAQLGPDGNTILETKSDSWKSTTILAGNTEGSSPILISAHSSTNFAWTPIAVFLRAKQSLPMFAFFQIRFVEFPTAVAAKPFFSDFLTNAQGQQWISTVPPTSK